MVNDVFQVIRKSRTPINVPLTNISTAYFQRKSDGALNFFPRVPVSLSSSFYYKFDKASLLRDDVLPKPILGKVAPTVVAADTDNYKCSPDQIILGFDEINQSDILRTGAPGIMDLRKNKSKIIAEKIYIHQNRLFARNYFNESVWNNTLKGGSTVGSGVDFVQFDNDTSDPVGVIRKAITDMKRSTGRTPNKLGMGQRVFDVLCENTAIKERVIYGGSTINPALVNENVLAQVFGVEKLVVFDSIWNSSDLGETENMEFICDENSMLLVYATDAPAIDEPSAGYTFTWDMGIGSELPIVEWEGEDFTYSRYIGGMMSYDMRIVCNDLGVFFKDAVSGV